MLAENIGFHESQDTAVLESLALDVSACIYLRASFWYNMYGSTMGSLKVEVGSSTGSDRVKVFEASGNKGQTWFEFAAQVETETAWTGSAKLFITGTDSGGYRSDMAIDDVALGCFRCGTPSEMLGLDGSTCVTSCPTGAIQNQGTTACVCPAGHQPNPDKTACEACGPGTFASAGIASCLECPVGRVQPSSGQGSCVWNCSKPGHFLDLRVGQCSPCNPGTFDPLG